VCAVPCLAPTFKKSNKNADQALVAKLYAYFGLSKKKKKKGIQKEILQKVSSSVRFLAQYKILEPSIDFS
jgi:hypothetical protein